MPAIEISPALRTDPRMRRAGFAAIGFWLALATRAHRDGTTWRLSDAQLRSLARSIAKPIGKCNELLKALQREGLIERINGGWELVNDPVMVREELLGSKLKQKESTLLQ